MQLNEKADIVEAMAGACGYIDAIESGRIYGWAWNPGNPDMRLRIDIYRGGQLIGSEDADRFRADLLRLGVGDGKHSFVLTLPPELRSVAADEFSAYFHGTDLPLLRGPRVAPQPGEPVPETPSAETPSQPPADPRITSLLLRTDKVEASMSRLIALADVLYRRINVVDQTVNGITLGLASEGPRTDTAQPDFQALSARLENAAQAISDVELFLMRFDVRLKDAADAGDLKRLEARLAAKPGRLLAFAAGFVGSFLALPLALHWGELLALISHALNRS